MKNKVLKLTALIAALLLIGFILVFANSMVGNPVSKYIVRSSAEKYMEEQYSGTDFFIEEVNYSFKVGKYYVRISSPTSIDSHFSLNFDQTGKLFYDSYENDVASKWNTAVRLDEEYRNMVNEVLDSPDFPYKSRIDFGGLKIIFAEEKPDEHAPGPVYGQKIEQLELDKEYDIRALGEKCGQLTLYIEKVMDEKEGPFFSMDFTLEYPRNEDWTRQNEEEINILNFPYSDIYEEGMTERVEKAITDTKNYYDFMDSQKS